MTVAEAGTVIQILMKGGESVTVIPIQPIHCSYPDFSIMVLRQGKNSTLRHSVVYRKSFEMNTTGIMGCRLAERQTA